jgi:hypothetical protein
MRDLPTVGDTPAAAVERIRTTGQVPPLRDWRRVLDAAHKWRALRAREPWPANPATIHLRDLYWQFREFVARWLEGQPDYETHQWGTHTPGCMVCEARTMLAESPGP